MSSSDRAHLLGIPADRQAWRPTAARSSPVTPPPVDPYVSTERVQEIARQAAYKAYTASTAVDESPDVLEATRITAAARELSAATAQFDPAWSANLGGYPVVPLDPSGTEPVGEPMTDLSALVEFWSANPDAPAGLPCGREHDRLAAAVDQDGYERLVQLAAPPQADRGDADYGLARRGQLDHAGSPLRLVERKPPAPPMRAVVSFGMDPEEVEKALDWGKAAGIQTRGYALAWRWPVGEWSFKAGRIARGTHVLAAIPLAGSIVARSGRPWVVQAPPPQRFLPCPTWVAADVLNGKQLAVA